MEQMDYTIVFEKLEEVLRQDAQEADIESCCVSPEDLSEIEELSRFVSELNEAPLSTYTTA